MITLMIMAQDYTAFEPVTSGVWIDKTIDPNSFNEVYVIGIKHNSTIMCGDKVMGTYSHERAVEIMKDIANRNEYMSDVNLSGMKASVKDSSLLRVTGDLWTYYMPQE